MSVTQTDSSAAAALDHDRFIGELQSIAGSDGVMTEERARTLYSTDIFRPADVLPLAVVRPTSVDQLGEVVRLCVKHGVALVPRGGGASYTDGYLPVVDPSITIDTGGLDRICEINEQDMYVTVEPGVTWKQLNEALAEKNLRTPFWGPFSGFAATVGGSLSQNSVNYGTGLYGTSGESVLSFEIITGTGEILKTGSAANEFGVPHYRCNGPDLTGLFTGDCGALGIKARITMRLMQREAAVTSCSFGFQAFDDFIAATIAIGRLGIVSDHFGMDPRLQRGTLDRMVTTDAIQAALSVLKTSDNIVSGLYTVAKMGLAGRRFLKKASWMAHFTVEGSNRNEARAKLRTVRRIASQYGAELANTVPTVIRANPFMPLTPMVGPRGERWKPTHGILPFSRVAEFNEAFDKWREGHQAEMDRLNVFMTKMFMTVGTNAFLFEPTFLWQDQLTIVHEAFLPEEFRKNLPVYEDSPEGRALVKQMKSELVELFHQFGASHLQIGKDYPFLRNRHPATAALLRDLKKRLDPDNLMNPGALGF